MNEEIDKILKKSGKHNITFNSIETENVKFCEQIIFDYSKIRELIIQVVNTNVSRKMNYDVCKTCYGKDETILFSINGSPPRGYGLYSIKGKSLMIFNMNRIKIIEIQNIVIDLQELKTR